MNIHKRERALYRKTYAEMEGTYRNSRDYSSDTTTVTYRRYFSNRREIHLVGENHESGSSVRLIHETIVPLMRVDSRSWLIFKEGTSEELVKGTSPYYVCGLGKIFAVPTEEAITPLEDPQLRKSIMTELSMTEENLDRFDFFSYLVYICYEMGHDFISELSVPEIEEVLNIYTTETKKPREYAIRLCLQPFLNEGEFNALNNRIMMIQNRVSKERFRRILIENEDRSNILVSVGIAHLEAFE